MSNAAPRPRSGTLGDLLDEIAAATPDAPAVVFRAERLDYANLKARADGFAKALLAAGVRRGDRMGLLVTNRSDWLVAAFGAATIGAVTAAIADVAAILGFCRERMASYKVPARLAFYTADQLPRTPTGKIHKPRLAKALAAKGSRHRLRSMI